MLTDAPTEDGLAPGGAAHLAPLGPTARALAEAARAAGIPVRRWGPALLQLGQGMRHRLCGVTEAEPGGPEGLRAAGLEIGGPGAQQVLVVGWRAFAASRRATRGPRSDATSSLEPEAARLAERAADVLGLDVANVELTEDLRVASVTAGARLDWHPARARAAARAILDLLFPPGTPTRVPLVVTIDEEAVTACLAGLLGVEGTPVGVGRDARVLGHPHVGTAVIARATAAPGPLGFDRADVVVVGARAAADPTVRVVRRLSRDGALIVHADHPDLYRIAAATDARLVVHHVAAAEHPVLNAALGSGSAVAYVSPDDAVVVRRGRQLDRVLERASESGLPGELADVVAAAAAAWFLRTDISH